MTPDEARKVKREPVEPGKEYEFYCEMQQEYELPENRLRRFTGQFVTVIHRAFGPGDQDWVDGESSCMYEVEAKDGTVFHAWEEELNGWDFDLGQYFLPENTNN